MTDTTIENAASSSAASAKAHEGALKRSAEIRNSVGLASETEMAAILQVSEETLATWRSKKRGPPSIKLGKKVFYMIDDFSQWVMQEVSRQSANADEVQKQSQNRSPLRRVYKPVVHVDEDTPGVHVQY